MFLNGFTNGTKDNTLLTKLLLKRGLNRNRIHDGIHSRIATQGQALFERNTQLVKSLNKLRIETPFRLPRRGVT